VVKWLRVNLIAGCTTQGMNEAATNGHCHVVKWLYAEGCTKAAMDLGPFHVVQWLHTHRSKGCTNFVVNNVVNRGD
ncbi:hypothetical protein PHYSODRAFT_506259, partial [Phytophthora sojae]